MWEKWKLSRIAGVYGSTTMFRENPLVICAPTVHNTFTCFHMLYTFIGCPSGTVTIENYFSLF